MPLGNWPSQVKSWAAVPAFQFLVSLGTSCQAALGVIGSSVRLLGAGP